MSLAIYNQQISWKELTWLDSKLIASQQINLKIAETFEYIVDSNWRFTRERALWPILQGF